jgi:hypothetical protein
MVLLGHIPELIAKVDALTADRDAHREASREAEDAHDRADDALCAIHATLWPGRRTDWVAGEATGMAGAIVAGVKAAVAERDALRGAVDDKNDALKRALSLRVMGYNECHASLCPGGVDCTGTSESTYANNAERIEQQIRRALAPAAPPGDAGTAPTPSP